MVRFGGGGGGAGVYRNYSTNLGWKNLSFFGENHGMLLPCTATLGIYL